MIDNQMGRISLTKIIRLVMSVLLLTPVSGFAFNQPAVNLSATTFMDGGAPPGFYYVNYVISTQGKEALDHNGNVIPGNARVNALVDLHQFYYISTKQFLGANMALDVAIPLVAVTSRGTLGGAPLTTNTAGLGDFLIGPALHWDGKQLFGQPAFYRFESDFTFRTGKYDKGQPINPGANLFTWDSYFSVFWLFRPKWETSWRFWYTFHGNNGDHPFGKVKPGQLVRLNYAVSREIVPKWRLGAAGYHLHQITDDTINGVKTPNTRERVTALGPGLTYMGNGIAIFLSHPIEFNVRNRFRGSRTTLEFIHKF